MSEKEFVQYVHNGKKVWVRKDLKGTHRDVCLCYDCTCFHPGIPEDNCPVANLIFATCVAAGVVTPVYECPLFEQGERYKFTTETGLP